MKIEPTGDQLHTEAARHTNGNGHANGHVHADGQATKQRKRNKADGKRVHPTDVAKEAGATEQFLFTEKPLIIAEPGKLSDIVERAMRHLVERDADIFRRGEKLVRPAIGQGIDSKERVVQFPILLEIDHAYMRLTLCKHINWFKPDRRFKNGPIGPGFKRIDAPEYVAKAIMSSAGNWPFRPITGVISTPTLRHDGSILDQQGYDPRTHVYLHSDVALPPISVNPSKEEADRALKVLEGLLSEFPFVNSASKSVALSAMLSAVARSMFDVVPAHGARAPAAGTGKSYLFDIVSSITAGERCPVISASANEDETEKRVIGAALSGQLIINIDNVNGTLGGDALCQLIERPVCNLRPLGQSPHVRIDNRAIVFFNGNNCHVRGDMTRRAILAELDARMEKPAEREFKGDPVATVFADRGLYIAACMTVMRGYISAGRPKQTFVPMNSFGEWSGIVRSALVWLGRADPCETIKKAREEDPELQKLAAFIAALQPHADDKRDDKGNLVNAVSVSRLVELCLKEEFRDDGRVSERVPQHPELNSFVQEFITYGTKPNPQRIGRWLGKFKGRVISEDADGKCVQLRIASIFNSKRKSDDWYIETLPAPTASGNS